MAVDSADTTALAVSEHEAAGLAALEHVLGSGDLSQLTNAGRVGHYIRLCRSLGLNELSRPFDWLWMKGEGETERLVLYPNQSCAAQLRRQHHMRIEITRRDVVGELFVVEARATTPDGRYDTATKYVPLTNRYGPLRGNQRANAMMKAETGAKRRVTLSMVGLAVPPSDDEETSWRPAVIDGTGRVIDNPTDTERALAGDPRMARTLGEPVYEDLDIDDADPPPSQAVRPDELIPPRRDPNEPRPTFGMDVRRALGAWFAIVKGTYLDDDDARHAFVRAYTEQRWVRAAQTSSLETFFRRATEPQAREFLAHVRELCEVERARPEPEPEPEPEPARAPAPETEPLAEAIQPERPDPHAAYTRPELFALYDAWGAYMRYLDAGWEPEHVRQLADKALRRKVDDLVAQAIGVADFYASQASQEDEPEPEAF